MNGDEYITLSANGDGGEISRRVALSSGLTFNFATALKVANIKSINNAADTLYISYFNTIIFAGAKVVGLVNPSYDSDNATPTAAGAEKIATKLKDFCNVYKEFTAPVAPADSIQAVDSTDTADTIHVAPVVPADSIQAVDSTDTADTIHVVRRRNFASMFNVIKVAAVLLLVFVLRTVSTIDTTADTIHVAPVASADSIQAVDSTDAADTIHVAHAAPVKNLYIIGHAKN